MPPDFRAVAAYRCDTFASVEDAEGRWLATTTERQEDDLAPLIAALDEPDDLVWPGPCAASLTIVPALWLENGDGDAVRVAYPVDGGGQPKYARVKKARDRLMVAETISERGELQEPRVAIDTGCPAALDPVKVVGVEDLQGAPGLDVRNGLGSASPEFDRAVPQAVLVPPAVSTDEEINGMRLCRYGSAATALHRMWARPRRTCHWKCLVPDNFVTGGI